MKTNKNTTLYGCSNCGDTFNKWSGSCPSCHEWNTLTEVKQSVYSTSNSSKAKITSDISIANINSFEEAVLTEKIKSSNKAWDNVLSGGMAKGQVILFSGDPGIGKSTLLLQVISKLQDHKVLYFSGEETTHQIISRAKRINSDKDSFSTTDFVNLNSIEELEGLVMNNKYQIAIIDSIQTIASSESGGFPGSVNQIRECTIRIAEMAKRNNITFIIVGQVTKEGDIAGPKLLEHLVDTVMYFDGDRRSDLRTLKIIKNRYGSTNEVAFFEMNSDGLNALDNPSSLIIDRNKKLMEGSCYSLALEGNIPVIVEIQALCNRSVFNYPKFVSTGFPLNRLQMLSAIITKRTKINLSDQDIYLNIIGGIKIDDPQIDLGVCMALASSFFKKPISNDEIFFGEVGLTGEIRTNKSKEKRNNSINKNSFKLLDFNEIKSLSQLFNTLK